MTGAQPTNHTLYRKIYLVTIQFNGGRSIYKAFEESDKGHASREYKKIVLDRELGKINVAEVRLYSYFVPQHLTDAPLMFYIRSRGDELAYFTPLVRKAWK